MRASYDRSADTLLIHVGRGKVDYAEEVGPFVIHFTKRGKPLLIEILDASEVLSNLTKVTMRSKKAIPFRSPKTSRRSRRDIAIFRDSALSHSPSRLELGHWQLHVQSTRRGTVWDHPNNHSTSCTRPMVPLAISNLQ
jgi:uncharacterized protein YuzE